MDTNTAEMFRRIEQLEENLEILRARHGVTRRVLHGVLEAVEIGALDGEGLIRRAIVDTLRPQIEGSDLDPKAKKAALDVLDSFADVSHQTDPEDMSKPS